MEKKKSRVSAKIFLALTILVFLALAAASAYYISLQDWMPYRFTFELPFTLKHEYLMIGSGATLVLLIITILLFACPQKRKPAVEEAEDEYEDFDEMAFACAATPAAVDGAEKAEKPQNTTDQAKRVAKVALPIVGACIAGIAIGMLISKNKKD